MLFVRFTFGGNILTILEKKSFLSFQSGDTMQMTSGPLVYKGGFSSLLILYTRLSIMCALVTHFSSVRS